MFLDVFMFYALWLHVVFYVLMFFWNMPHWSAEQICRTPMPITYARGMRKGMPDRLENNEKIQPVDVENNGGIQPLRHGLGTPSRGSEVSLLGSCVAFLEKGPSAPLIHK